MMYGVGSEQTASDSDASSSGSEAARPGGVTEAAVRDDPDLLLVPTIIDKVVLPKVTGESGFGNESCTYFVFRYIYIVGVITCLM